MPSTVDPTLFPVESHFFDSSRGRIHYVDEGDGPVVLLCHGAPTWSFLYRHVISGLEGRVRCIAADNLGFGLSARPEGFGYTIAEHTRVLGELVDNLEIDDVVIVGHDWGGSIGLGVGVERSERIRGVVLTNTVAWPVDAFANRAFSVIMDTPPARHRILRDNLLVERFLVSQLRADLSTAELDQYRAVQPDPDSRVGLAATPRQIRAARPLLANLEHDVTQRLGRLPAAAVWGKRDPVFSARRCLPRVQAMFSAVSVRTSPSGHFLPEQDPDALVEAIRDVLRR